MPLVDQFLGADEDRARVRRRGLVRGSARVGGSRRVDRSRAGRERGRGDVLHERHDRAAEGRRLLAPLDDAAHARVTAAANPLGLGLAEQDAILPGRPDVPCERLGVSVHRRDAGGEADLPRPAPRCREPARRTSCRSASPGRRACRRSGSRSSSSWTPTRTDGTCRHERDARRRLGSAAGDDRGLPGASRTCGSATAGG